MSGNRQRHILRLTKNDSATSGEDEQKSISTNNQAEFIFNNPIEEY